MPTHHLHQVHKIPFSRQKVLNLIHDPVRFVNTSTQIKEMKQDDADPQKWTITENLELLLNTTTTFTAKMEPTPQGLKNTCWASSRVKVESELKVTESDPSSNSSQQSQAKTEGTTELDDVNKEEKSECFIEETSSVFAPFYVFWLVKLQFVKTHKAFGQKVTDTLRKEEAANK